MNSFKLSHNPSISCGTSNVTHLLSRDDHDAVLDRVDVRTMTKIFGEKDLEFHPGDYEYYQKGYTDPAWYFHGPDDAILGIGFRHGQPRLRGGSLHGGKLLTASELASIFVSYLLNEIAASKGVVAA